MCHPLIVYGWPRGGKTISVVIVNYIKCKLFLSHRKRPSEMVFFFFFPSACGHWDGGAMSLWDESVCVQYLMFEDG